MGVVNAEPPKAPPPRNVRIILNRTVHSLGLMSFGPCKCGNNNCKKIFILKSSECWTLS